MPDHDTDDKALGRAMAILSEHFDTATVLVSRFNGETGCTVSSWRGYGNWHARYGHVREWLVKRDAEARVEARRDMDGG